MNGKRVVGYIRVSSKKQAEHGVSLEAQQEKLRQYAALYELTLVDIIVDRASAKTLHRPDLQRALAFLTSGQADALLVTKLDRLTRSVKDLGMLIERYFSRYTLMSVADQVDTSTAAGRLVLNVLMSVAQWEREAIGERTREALHHKKANGEKLGGDAPYGYQATADGRLVEDLDEQAMLALIRHYRAEGLSLRAITAALTRQGYTTRKGTPFQVTQVTRMVKALQETA
jgi:DNA invertase Pin-like site-specific DNA recombinase